MDKKTTIYLSGPISGYDINERIETFQEKQNKFEQLGYTVMNPLANGISVNAPTCMHMREDFKMLLQCDAIYMMERWLHSAGCKVEFDVATACGMDVYFEEKVDVNLGNRIKFA